MTELDAERRARVDADEAQRRAYLAALLLFAVQPSDRALAGWGIGSAPYSELAHMAQDAARADAERRAGRPVPTG
jgi:hypothetical protein